MFLALSKIFGLLDVKKEVKTQIKTHLGGKSVKRNIYGYPVSSSWHHMPNKPRFKKLFVTRKPTSI